MRARYGRRIVLKVFISVYVVVNICGVRRVGGNGQRNVLGADSDEGYDGSQTLGNFTPWSCCAFLESFALITSVSES